MANINNSSVLQRLYTSGFDTDFILSTPTKSFDVHKAIVQDFFLLDHIPDGCNDCIYDDLSDASLDAMLQHIYGLPVTCLQPKQEYTTEAVIQIFHLQFATHDYPNFDPLYDKVVGALEQILSGLNDPSQLIDIGLYMCSKDHGGWIPDELCYALMARVQIFMLEILRDNNLWKKLDSCERFK